MIKEFNVNFTEKEISLVYQKVKDYPWDSIGRFRKLGSWNK
jgi:microsomal epoxide hydrolase